MSGLRWGSPKGERAALLRAALASFGLLALQPAWAQPAPAPAPPAAAAPAPAPAQTPAQSPAAPAGAAEPLEPKGVGTVRVTPDKPFAGEEITLSPVPVLTLSGNASWEEAYDKLVATQKQVEAELKRLGLTRTGNVFVVYTTGDDLGFDYEVQVPFSGTTTQKPQGGMKLSGSHAGKALKFTHSGSFADMDNTYEQIANYLDDKNVEQNELYIEQYRTDLATAAPEALVIDILVPVP